MKISDDEHLYEELHRDEAYGIGGGWFRPYILDFVKNKNIKTVIDYGCGKGRLVRALKEKNIFKYVCGFDPYVGIYAERASSFFDLLISTDFFEHVEEKYLVNIANDMWEFRPKYMFHAVSNRPSASKLGKNPAHKIVKDGKWWKEKLALLFPFHNVTELFYNDKQKFTVYGFESS